MKKSKLLIPLASLAGVATIAMPICLTSCGGQTIEVEAEETSTGSGIWESKDSFDVDSKNTYNFTLPNSKGKTGTITIYGHNEASAYLYCGENSVKINGVQAKFKQTLLTTSFIYEIPEGLSSETDMVVSVKFTNSVNGALVGFIITE